MKAMAEVSQPELPLLSGQARALFGTASVYILANRQVRGRCVDLKQEEKGSWVLTTCPRCTLSAH